MYYSSDQSNELDCDYDCFDYHQDDLAFSEVFLVAIERNQQIIPFCRRGDLHDELVIRERRIATFTFEQLNNDNISSLDLYRWFAPIDLIEHYQAFREGRTSSSSLKFSNCSSVNRFGSFCQYGIQSVGLFKEETRML